ncbi:hypothetical protein AXF42_Ash014004 [Apostasia shenzhenica]|uniref:3'-5' exonuclease domain-containing protein n=1 Tax=Apostasia shenzhenica TaxID=1088818 RepID=A0A2I0A954_9ASPA|nr:hypothetical protein AXF42_Ash014004 [Apostasia shenzhenica]
MVRTADSPEFSLLQWAFRNSCVVALDAEWKPANGGEPSFPMVTLLQVACRLASASADSPIFLVDLLSVPLRAIWELLRELFVSPSVLKLGFKFKQDFAYLSSTFSSQGCHPGFDRVEPFIDVTSIYYNLKSQKMGKRIPKETKSLATICREMLNICLSKELQCSDWSHRPLTEGQISYAAADAYYLLEIFAIFERHKTYTLTEFSFSNPSTGLKEILMDSSACQHALTIKFNAFDITKSSLKVYCADNNVRDSNSQTSCKNMKPQDENILVIANKFGERILLTESDRKPRASRRKVGRRSCLNTNIEEQLEINYDWQGPPPWDPAFGGDDCPKFLCDVMVEGLARHLRCVGIDAAVPTSKKTDPRQLLNQAYKEKRVLLTRDAKLLKHQYLISNQVYRVKNLLKNDQLLEVIETFHLKIEEEQLMSRCTKCNGSFIQKPLTLEEAIEASKGFQVIPNCLFNREIEFWQCTDCRQLYWEVKNTVPLISSLLMFVYDSSSFFVGSRPFIMAFRVT